MAEDDGDPVESKSFDVASTDRTHVFGTWAYQNALSPTRIVDADGVHFTAADGTDYLDVSNQLMCSNLGHSAEAIADQCGRARTSRRGLRRRPGRGWGRTLQR